jgi:hypothetical protein
VTPVCGNCFFYRTGSCRKSPPVRLPRRFDTKATEGNRVRDEELIWGWPVVGYKGWCGEHRPGTQEAGDA